VDGELADQPVGGDPPDLAGARLREPEVAVGSGNDALRLGGDRGDRELVDRLGRRRRRDRRPGEERGGSEAKGVASADRPHGGSPPQVRPPVHGRLAGGEITRTWPRPVPQGGAAKLTRPIFPAE